MPNWTRKLTLLAVAVALGGCGGTALRVNDDVGAEKVVERSPEKKPDWLEEPFKEKNDQLYFGGEANKVFFPLELTNVLGSVGLLTDLWKHNPPAKK